MTNITINALQTNYGNNSKNNILKIPLYSTNYRSNENQNFAIIIQNGLK